MSARPIMTPEAVARWWGLNPSLQSSGSDGRGACALWSFQSDGAPIEVEGEADPNTHIVSIYCGGRSRQEYFGDGRFQFARQCRPGLVNIVRAGEKPRAVLNGDQKVWSYYHIYMPHSLLVDAVVASELLVRPEELELVDPRGVLDQEIWQTTNVLLRELQDNGPLSRLRIDTLHQDVAIQLLRRHSNLSRNAALLRKPARGGLAPWQLQRAIDAIDAHVSEDISLEMLAAVAGCSTTHFSRAFKQSTGMPPFQWLLERRIARAKEALSNARTPIADVALAVGFSAQPQFTTAFKRMTGVTPGAWRRQNLL